MSGAASELPRLGEISSRLDALQNEQDALYSERLKLWRAARERKVPLAELARASSVTPITVRKLLAKGTDSG